MSDIKSSLLTLAKHVETRNLDEVSRRVGAVMREISAASARESQIEIESWPDFLDWWNNNRGQNLIYIFMDTYGAESEQVRMVKKLVTSAEKHEKELHEFYMRLRDLTNQQLEGEQPQQGAEGQDVAPPDAAAQQGAPAPAADDSGGTDEDSTLDELALELEKE